MKGITATTAVAAAAVCCLATTASVSASLPHSSSTSTFGIARRNSAFAGLDSRGGAVGKLKKEDFFALP